MGVTETKSKKVSNSLFVDKLIDLTYSVGLAVKNRKDGT